MTELILGDCLEKMSDIADGSVDMILTDPPYGTTACAWDSTIPLGPMWEQLKRIIKPNGAIVMTAAQPFTTHLISSNMGMFKYEWIWEKSKSTGYLNANIIPLKSHENIIIFSNNKAPYFPIMELGTAYNSKHKPNDSGDCYGETKESKRENITSRFPNTIIKIRTEKNSLHPTQKPVKLMEYLILTYTNKGETVLDFTMGSGTTGVACIETGRDFIGIELDESYFKIAQDRIEKAQSEPRLDFGV